MSRTTLVREFLRGVSNTLQDVAPQYERFGERELVTFANYAQRALAKFLPQAGTRVDTIKLVPGTRQDLTFIPAARILPGDGSAPADTYGIAFLDIVRNMGANGLVAGRVVRGVDRQAKDANDPSWHLRTSTELREYIFDRASPRTLLVSPGVPAAGLWAEVSWMAEPTRIPAGGAPGSELYAMDGASTALMGIQDLFIEDAHNYVVGMALLKGSKNTANLPKSQHHVALFTSSVNAQAKVLSGVNPNLRTLPFADAIEAKGAT